MPKINVALANTKRVGPDYLPSDNSVLFMLADADFAEEWGKTLHPVHIISKIVSVYNTHYEAHEDLWNDDAAVRAFVEDVETHADLVDYVNNVALQDEEFVYNCLQGSGL
jgi:hypothetical protein